MVPCLRGLKPWIGFMLIWRGPRKNGLIKQFLKDVVDAPPGTSDEHISIVQFLQATGQQLSLIDVRKEVTFCKKVGLNVNMSGMSQPLSEFKFLSVGETGEQRDMTEWAIEYMKEKAPEMLKLVAFSEVFDCSGGGADKMCRDMDVPFLGKVPLDPQLCKAAEEGRSCFEDSRCRFSSPALKEIVEKLLSQIDVQKMEVGA